MKNIMLNQTKTYLIRAKIYASRERKYQENEYGMENHLISTSGVNDGTNRG